MPNDPNDPVDQEAARRIDALWNRMFLDPVLRGSYPADLLRDVEGLGLGEVIRDGDLETIHQPIDFLGVNHYHDDNVSGHPLPAGEAEPVLPTESTKAIPVRGQRIRELPRPEPAAHGHGLGGQPAGAPSAAEQAGERLPGPAGPLHHRERCRV